MAIGLDLCIKCGNECFWQPVSRIRQQCICGECFPDSPYVLRRTKKSIVLPGGTISAATPNRPNRRDGVRRD